MPRYRYRAKSLDGKTDKGAVNAADEAELLKILRSRGLHCYDYSQDTGERDIKFPKVRLKLIPPLCRQLSAMLAAGVPLSKALSISYESTQEAGLRDILMKIREEVHGGHTLSEAMEKMDGAFPNLLVYMVQTGEYSGRVDELLEKMAEYYSREEALYGKVRTAMTYPVILLVITLLASVFMLTMVLPQFASMLSEQDLPWITRFMMDLSASMREHWPVYIFIILILIALSMGLLLIPSVRLKADRALLFTPVIGKFLQTVNTSRFATTFAVLYGSGVGVLEAMHTAGRVMGNSFVEKSLGQAAENLKKGELLSQVLKSMDIFHPVLISMVVAGEESGALDKILGDAGGYYEREAGRAVSQMIALLEPVMILILALIVGSVVMAIMLPVFNMYSSML